MDLLHVWFKGNTLSGRVLKSFWCDSDNKNLYFCTFNNFSGYLVTVLYFSIISVFWLLNLCGVGGDASFVHQANLVYKCVSSVLRSQRVESSL